MRKLANERVSAVERVGEATSEEQVEKWSKRANEQAEEWEAERGDEREAERGDEQVAHFWRPDFKGPLSIHKSLNL